MRRSKGGGLFRIICVICSFLLIIAGLFFSIRSLIGSRDFFLREYTKLDNARTMGMSTEDLTNATMQMIYYMEGRAESIDITVTVNGEQVSMFNERESAHMVDVRALYQGWLTTARICLGMYVLTLAAWFLFVRGRPLFALARGFAWAAAAFGVLLFAVGLWVLVDFSSFWTAFHHLFFTNDLWLLDPATSRMINMMPLGLFYDIVTGIVVRFVLPLLLLTGLSVWIILRNRKAQVRQSRDLMRRAADAHLAAQHREGRGQE